MLNMQFGAEVFRMLKIFEDRLKDYHERDPVFLRTMIRRYTTERFC